MTTVSTQARARQTKLLQRLIDQCTEDSKTFRLASAAAATAGGGEDSATYRDELLAIARRRSSFAETLAGFVREMGGTPPIGGTVVAWMRRGLFGMRVSVLGTTHLGDSLAACAEQLERTNDVYRRALDLDWSTDVLRVLETQKRDVEATHARVRTLRGAS